MLSQVIFDEAGSIHSDFISVSVDVATVSAIVVSHYVTVAN